ncbi:hypothetical protein [Vibrio diabolicus]|uniref:hypothetical protein n=1 Tax=Vibrio diabolicus TaxID=50719 RepID=UPI000CE9419D|nr:hypothetical protein [Vibrio diabolicus]AVF58873.1 hypothetical protein AL537_05740 [Vibrio diabolicus]
MKNKVLYVIPSIEKKNSGPAVRVSNIIQSKLFGSVISGSGLSKFSDSLKVESKSLIYVESSTNRLNVIDLFCLIFLKYIKACDIHVYIRDCYTILFPGEYSSFRKKITKILLDLTNRFYISLSKKLYFPTLGMGDVYCTYYNVKKDIGALPPGIVEDEYKSFSFPKVNDENTKYIIHVGGLQYRYSGVNELINFAYNLDKGLKLLLVTRDEKIVFEHSMYPNVKDNIEILSLNRDGVIERLRQGDIIAAVHSRPINNYDAITYPIKVLDYISWKLPIITLKHEPIIELLSEDYPLFYSDISEFSYNEYFDALAEIKKIYNDVSIGKNYRKIMLRLEN